MAAKPKVDELRAAIERIRRFRSLFEQLHDTENRLDGLSSDWDQERCQQEARALRREMTRLAEDVHRDLSRRGDEAATLYLHDAPAMGGRVYRVAVVEALINGSARAYHVSPDVVDPQFEATIDWYEKQVAAAPPENVEGRQARAQVGSSEQRVPQSEDSSTTNSNVNLDGPLQTWSNVVGLITGSVVIGGWVVSAMAGLIPWWPF